MDATAVAVPDPIEPLQWNLLAVGAPAAWAALPGPHGVVVAFVDTGADLAHADLLGAYWNGNVWHGASLAEPFGAFSALPVGADSTTMDEDGHGTSVAGVATAASRNGVGLRGVAEVEVMLVKTGGIGAFSTVPIIASGIRYAVDAGARVVSVSQVALASTPELASAVAYAESKGVVVVAAAGNDGTSRRMWPAAYGTVVSVAATDAADAVWPDSSYGKVDLAAPGVGVPATSLGNGYALVTGTSFATPHVSAVAALVLAADPTLAPADVRQILNATARDVGPAGRDARTGWGVVDAGAAAAAALAQEGA